MFRHFGLKLLFWGQNLTFLEVNRGQMLKLNILTSKRHILADSAHFEPYASKSVKGFNLCACLRKKSQENDIKSPICPEVPRERIFFTKL